MSRPRNLAAYAALAFTLALASPSLAVTPDPGFYAWQGPVKGGAGMEYADAIQAVVETDSRSFNSLTISAACGKQHDYYRVLRAGDSKVKISKKGKFELSGKLVNDAETDSRKFSMDGEFTKVDIAKFTLSVDKCAKDRKGKLTPNM